MKEERKIRCGCGHDFTVEIDETTEAIFCPSCDVQYHIYQEHGTFKLH